MKKALLLFWIVLNVLIPPPVQAAYSTDYFDNELDCIDQILSDPNIFYSILESFDEESCADGKELKAEDIFKVAKELKENSTLLSNSENGLNDKIKHNLTESKEKKHMNQVTVFEVDNAHYEDAPKNNRKHLDNGKTKKSSYAVVQKVQNMIKITLEEKVKEIEKKTSIEKKSGNILNDDKKTFKSLADEDTDEILDPKLEEEIIKKSIGDGESQKFGSEIRTKGDEAGDLLFNQQWSYQPLEINEFQFEMESLDDSKTEEFTWQMPKKQLQNTHKIIERKNYLGGVKVEVKEKTISKPENDTEFTFQPIDFSQGMPSNPGFNSFGGFETLDDVKGEDYSGKIHFDNQNIIEHHIINNNKNIGNVEIQEMIIDTELNSSHNSIRSPEKSAINKSNKSSSHKSQPVEVNESSESSTIIQQEKTPKTSPSHKTEIHSNMNPSMQSFKAPDFKMDTSELNNSESSDKTGGLDPNHFKKPEINNTIIDQNKKPENVNIHVRSEESSSSSQLVESEHNDEIKSKKTSKKSSSKTSPEKSNSQSPSHKSNDNKSIRTFDSIQDHKYRDIEQNSSFSAIESSHQSSDSLMSFRPEISESSHPLFDNEDLGSEKTIEDADKTPIQKPKIQTDIDVVDNNKNIGEVVINDKDEDSIKSNHENSKKTKELTPNQSGESSSIIYHPELNKKKTKLMSESNDSSDMIMEDPSKSNKSSSVKVNEKTIKSPSGKTVDESEETSTKVIEESSQKTPEKSKKTEDNEESSSINVIEESTKTLEIKNQSEESSSVHVVEESVKSSEIQKTPKVSENSSETQVIEQSVKTKVSSKKSSYHTQSHVNSESEESNSFDDTESEESSPKDNFNVDPQNPIVNDDYHSRKKRKRNSFQGKTIIALQFSRSDRRLMSFNPRSHEEKRREILLMFNLLPACVQRALLSCKPKEEKAINKCQAKIPGLKCETQGMMAQFSCSSDETFFNGACYKKCPEDMRDDTLLCLKSVSKNRRAQAWSPETGSLDELNEEIYAGKLKVLKCEVFGPSYEAVGPDLCVQKCPYGWKNLGNSCMKPVRFINQPKIVLEADFA
jgi:hypothetical protein